VLREVRRLGIDVDAVVITAYGTIEAAVEAMKLGARDFLTKPFETGALLRLVERYGRVRAAARDEARLAAVQREGGCCGMIGRSRAMAEVFGVLAAVAETDATVLVQGETGTGKELVASAIHALSPRRDRPIVRVHCTALPETLIESELFGHERGAFTGAHQRREGRFEAADGGTIFLDEVEETPPAIQSKLLRVLQEREIQRVGSIETVKVDVRVVASSKRALRDGVAAGTFREDLFYRLNVMPVILPPLRDRHGDVPALAAHFLAAAAARMGRPARAFSPDAMAVLDAYPFPGNVRELRNLVERAVVLCPGETVGPEHLGVEVARAAAGEPAAAEAGPTLAEAVREAEVRRIEEALARAGGNRSRAAEILGISRKTLWEKLRRRTGGDPG